MTNSNTTALQKRSQVDLLLDDVETAVLDGVDNGIETCREKSVEVDFCNGCKMPSMYGKEDKNEISEEVAKKSIADNNMESLLDDCTTVDDGGDDKEENVKIRMPQAFEAKSPISPASLSRSGSQSVMGMSLTESFSYDGMPPPMSLETASTEKGDDDQFLQQHMSLNTEQPESPSNVLLPFTPRPGKSMFWRNVSITVAGRGTAEPDRKVLNNVYGEVPKNKTTAIIGSYGAG